MAARALFWSPSAHRLLATQIGARAWLVDPARAMVIAEVEAGGCAAWSPDGSIVAITRGWLKPEWELRTDDGELLCRHDCGGPISCLAFSHDASTIAVGTETGELRIYRAADARAGV
jgi:hypothetical protein